MGERRRVLDAGRRARQIPTGDDSSTDLNGYWDARAVIVQGYDAYLSSPGNSDKYYDDNAWMVLTFVEAYELTGERKYLYRAADAMRFVLSGWDEKLGGGIYWRENKTSKNTCSNGPSATAALALAQASES